MPRYKQLVNEDGTSRFVEIGAADTSAQGTAIQGDIEPFVSPIDHSVIKNRKQLREHMRKHNVVPAQEFSPEFYKAKAEERAREMNGQYNREETLARKREIWEIANHLERTRGG